MLLLVLLFRFPPSVGWRFSNLSISGIDDGSSFESSPSLRGAEIMGREVFTLNLGLLNAFSPDLGEGSLGVLLNEFAPPGWGISESSRSPVAPEMTGSSCFRIVASC